MWWKYDFHGRDVGYIFMSVVLKYRSEVFVFILLELLSLYIILLTFLNVGYYLQWIVFTVW